MIINRVTTSPSCLEAQAIAAAMTSPCSRVEKPPIFKQLRMFLSSLRPTSRSSLSERNDGSEMIAMQERVIKPVETPKLVNEKKIASLLRMMQQDLSTYSYHTPTVLLVCQKAMRQLKFESVKAGFYPRSLEKFGEIENNCKKVLEKTQITSKQIEALANELAQCTEKNDLTLLEEIDQKTEMLKENLKNGLAKEYLDLYVQSGILENTISAENRTTAASLQRS